MAVLTSGDCPDVLSHSAVRARNMGVLMAACLSEEVRGTHGGEGALVVGWITRGHKLWD